jgi:L-serine deaminase
MKVRNVLRWMPSLLPAGDDRQRLHARGFLLELVMSRGMRARMVMMWMRRMKHRQPMMYQHKMRRTRGIVEPVMSTGMRARMAMMMRLGRKMHCMPTMDPRRLCRTEGAVLEIVKI